MVAVLGKYGIGAARKRVDLGAAKSSESSLAMATLNLQGKRVSTGKGPLFPADNLF